MKIYFTASAIGKKLYENNYKKIYGTIEELGYKNLDDLILKINPKKFYLGDEKNRVQVYKNALNFIKQADLVILEVSVNSFSMGYVMDKTLEMGKPVILLYFEGAELFFAQGVQDEKLQVFGDFFNNDFHLRTD
jgi:nucleoside 2-deoxyribosyltransferase